MSFRAWPSILEGDRFFPGDVWFADIGLCCLQEDSDETNIETMQGLHTSLESANTFNGKPATRRASTSTVSIDARAQSDSCQHHALN